MSLGLPGSPEERHRAVAISRKSGMQLEDLRQVQQQRDGGRDIQHRPFDGKPKGGQASGTVAI